MSITNTRTSKQYASAAGAVSRPMVSTANIRKDEGYARLSNQDEL